VTWWQYGVPAQTFCLPPQPAVQLSFIDSFIHACIQSIAFFLSFFPFLPPQPAVQLSFVDSFIHSLKIAFNQSIFISFIPAATACSTALIY